MNTVELLQRLINYPTVSRDSNLELIHFAANYMEDLGAATSLVFNHDGNKANLYAVFGPDEDGGVLLSGHSDVVPAEGQPWTREPFRAGIEKNRMYGRGATDMKGFLASVLATLPELKNRKLTKPLRVAFSYDEEIGCVGVRGLIDQLSEGGPRPEFCIIGEPTSMQPSIAHKGKTAGVCRCTGVASHSALTDRGLNAIYLATDMINQIRALQKRIIEDGNQDHDYDVPYTTVHVGTIEGGTVVNIVPDQCRFGFEIRNLPGDDPDRLIERFNDAANSIVAQHRSRFADANISIEVTNQYPALDTAADAAAVAYVKSMVRDDTHGKLAFGTEGGLFQQRLGLPVVVCGPGSMDQGHKPDEFVTLDQLNRCDVFLERVVRSMVA